jgi:hypothetical protein
LTKKVLFGAEINKIQETLFRASMQRQVVGGSRLLVEFGKQATEKAKGYGLVKPLIKGGGGSFRLVFDDEKKAEVMAGSDLPAVLARHGFDWRRFVPEDDYSLLEQPLPRLCADRIDYFLRDVPSLGLATEADIQFALQNLVVYEGRIAAGNLQAARWMGYTYMAADQVSWANFREVGLYELTARAIKTGLSLGAVSRADFWQTDKLFWGKLHAHNAPALQAQLALISADTQFVWDEKAPTFRVSTKLRAIDPDVVVDGELRPLSSLDPVFARHRDQYLKRKRGKWPMRVVPSE